MAYSEQIFEAASQVLQARREQTKAELAEKKKAVYGEIKELAELDRQMANIGALAIKTIAAGGSPSEVSKLKAQNLQLQARKKALLANHKIPEEYLKPQYYCKKCEDTGYIKTGFCDCFKKLLINESAKELNLSLHLDRFSFSNFNLDFYGNDLVPGLKEPVTPRERAEENLNFCYQYATNFSQDSQNLLLLGGTGLGKTHLCLAIAGQVLNKGYSVVYISAVQLVASLEENRFYRNEQNKQPINSFLGCDLLIIDDFGSEAQTQFGVSSLYNIINSRVIKGTPTIINTNLSGLEIGQRYEERVASRLLGEYKALKFYGRDIRLLKAGL